MSKMRRKRKPLESLCYQTVDRWKSNKTDDLKTKKKNQNFHLHFYLFSADAFFFESRSTLGLSFQKNKKIKKIHTLITIQKLTENISYSNCNK